MCRGMIQSKAKELTITVHFEASVGWFQCFMKWEGLSLRCKTTIFQTAPADCMSKLVSFVRHMRSLQIRPQYWQDATVAKDNITCWLDMPSNTTVESTDGHFSLFKDYWPWQRSYIIILTARAYVVFKGKGTCLIKDLQHLPGIVVCFSTNEWMNNSLTVDYLRC